MQARIFERFMVDARDNAHLPTGNQTYTMIQGVLFAFRKRLDYRGALVLRRNQNCSGPD